MLQIDAGTECKMQDAVLLSSLLMQGHGKVIEARQSD